MYIQKKLKYKKIKEREREYNLNPYMCVIVIFFNCIVHMHGLYTNFNSFLISVFHCEIQKFYIVKHIGV